MDKNLYDFKVGETVCVHGKGFGVIKEIVERDVHPYAVVTMDRGGLDFFSLDVYPPQATRSL